MTERELLESIKKDVRRNEQEIYEFCEHNEITLEEYRKRIDISIAARKRPVPKDYPRAIIRKINDEKLEKKENQCEDLG